MAGKLLYTMFFLLLVINTVAQQKSSITSHGNTLKINAAVITANTNLPHFISALKSSSFLISSKKKDIPYLILDFLTQLEKDKFSVADSGQAWNYCCNEDDALPNRQLVIHGTNKNYFFMAFNTGGIATMQHLILLKYDNGIVNDFWTGFLPGKIQTKKAIITYLEGKL